MTDNHAMRIDQGQPGYFVFIINPVPPGTPHNVTHHEKYVRAGRGGIERPGLISAHRIFSDVQAFRVTGTPASNAYHLTPRRNALKTLVVHYSRSGNNRYLAGTIARGLGADCEELTPKLGGLVPLILLSLLKSGPGIKPLTRSLDVYDRVVVCGPIWMGQLIWPLYAFVKRYGAQFGTVAFVTCCGAGDDDKDGKFGYTRVFAKVKELTGPRCGLCAAVPITLALPLEKRKNDDDVMKLRLSDETCTGEIREKIDAVIAELAA